MTTTAHADLFAQLLLIHVKAIFPTYVESMAVLAKVDCRHTPKKT
jgi:hypothetical protein